MVGNAESGPTHTCWISIFIVMRSPPPRWLLYIKIGEALYSWTFAVLTSQKCPRTPNLVPLSFTLGLILVFSLTNTASTFKHDTHIWIYIVLHFLPIFLFSWFLSLPSFFCHKNCGWLKDLTGSISGCAYCGSPRTLTGSEHDMSNRALPQRARILGFGLGRPDSNAAP